MRKIIVTGPPLNGRDEYIEESFKFFQDKNIVVQYYHVFKEMQKVAKNYGITNLTRGNVLDLPSGIRDNIRNAAFENIINSINKDRADIVIISTPSRFYVEKSAAAPNGIINGLTDQIIDRINPDVIITFIDDLINVKKRLENDPEWRKRIGKRTLSVLANWRREAIDLIYQYLNKLFHNTGRLIDYVIFARSHKPDLFTRLCIGKEPRIYLSYHITGISKEYLEKVNFIKRKLEEKFIVIDPYAIKDWDIVTAYDNAMEKGDDIIKIDDLEISVDEVKDAIDEIRNQIVTRDHFLIECCHATLVLHYSINPSYGVMGEVVHTSTKTPNPTYVIYPFKKRLSPFFEYYVNPPRGIMVQGHVESYSQEEAFKEVESLINQVITLMEGDYKSGRWPRYRPP